jgi:hypothetical protein
MKEKPRNIRAGLSRRGCRGGLGGSPSNLTDQRPSLPFVPAFSLWQKFGELHRQFTEAFWRDLSQRVVRRYATRILEVTELSSSQFVLIPFLVCPNSDSTAAHQQSEPMFHQFRLADLRATQSLQAQQTYMP